MIKFSKEAYQGFVVNRRRYIPNEVISLNKDTIYYVSEDLIVTGWKAITSRPDFSGGISAYLPKQGIKTSKLYDAKGNLLYWYNDVGEVFIEGNIIRFNDLLFDVIVYPDGRITYMDIDEFALAVERNLITKEQEVKALRSYHFLVETVTHGDFSILQSPINELENFLKIQEH